MNSVISISDSDSNISSVQSNNKGHCRSDFHSKKNTESSSDSDFVQETNESSSADDYSVSQSSLASDDDWSSEISVSELRGLYKDLRNDDFGSQSSDTGDDDLASISESSIDQATDRRLKKVGKRPKKKLLKQPAPKMWKKILSIPNLE
jgi:hypothetical protein